jgi:hypothetical protein
MKPNEGRIDKIIRIVIGLAILIVVGFVMKSWWGLIGVPLLVTGLVSRCGLYSLLGINTIKKDTVPPADTKQ